MLVKNTGSKISNKIYIMRPFFESCFFIKKLILHFFLLYSFRNSCLKNLISKLDVKCSSINLYWKRNKEVLHFNPWGRRDDWIQEKILIIPNHSEVRPTNSLQIYWKNMILICQVNFSRTKISINKSICHCLNYLLDNINLITDSNNRLNHSIYKESII